jgi:hypothetical protein
MLCQTYIASVCGNRGSGPFYPAEWWVKVQVKRNKSLYISYEISGYSEYNEANKKTVFNIKKYKNRMDYFLENLLCVDTSAIGLE